MSHAGLTIVGQSSIKYQNGNYTSLMGKLEMAGGSITR